MADLKISQFANGGEILITDILAAVRGGVNTYVTVDTMAKESASDYTKTANLSAVALSGNASDLIGSTLANSIVTSSLTSLGTQSALLNMGNNKITNVTDPTNAQDAATKAYVDGVAAGLSIKASVQLATAAVLPTVTYSNGASGVGATLTASAVGVLTVDGVAVLVGDRILVKNQAAGLQNGIYVCTTQGTAGAAFVLTRATQTDQSAELDGAFTFVEGGTLAATGWVSLNSGTIVVGTTVITFTQFSGAGTYAGGTGISISGNTISISTVPPANGGTGATAVTGTGNNVLSASPTFTGTPILSTASASSILITGTVAPTNGMYLYAASQVAISASGTPIMRFFQGGTGDSLLSVNSQSAGASPQIAALGTAADIGINWTTKGAGLHAFYGQNVPQFIINPVLNAVNYMQVSGAAVGTSPSISAFGSDANMNVLTVAKGTGRLVNLGSYTNTSGTATAVHIDASGNLFRIASQRKYKDDVEPYEYDRAAHFIENCQPVYYRSNKRHNEGDKNSTFYGMIAEDVAAIEPRFAGWGYETLEGEFDEEGQPITGDELVPISVHYDLISMAVITYMRRKFEEYETRIKFLEKQ